MAAIKGHELLTRLNSGEGLNLIDVREEIEYYTFNIGGINIALSKFNDNIDSWGYNKTDEIIVICKIGLRSGTACKLLTEKGYRQARNLTGGLMELQKIK